MLLTQLDPSGAAREADVPRLLAKLAAPRAIAADYYRNAAPPRSYALVETFQSLEDIPPQADARLAQSGVTFARHICVQVADDVKSRAPAPVLMIVAFCVPPQRCGEVDDWYEVEHAPLLLRAEGWLRARRHHCIASEGNARWTHVALHDLRDLETLDSAERTFARSTEWRARLTRESWFDQAGRWVYERIAPENLS